MNEATHSPLRMRNEPRDKDRDYYMKQKDRIVGGNYAIPDGDFARFLGYAPPTDAEKAGKPINSGARVIELSLREQFSDLGKRALKSGMSARNMYISHTPYTNEPGRTRDQINDLNDAAGQGPEYRTDDLNNFRGSPGLSPNGTSQQYMKLLNDYQAKSREDNFRYLEMQYKFLYASKSFSTVSNLMKVRNEAVRQTMRDSR